MDPNDSAPVWDFFERIERLESLRPTAEDSLLLGVYAYAMAFAALVKDNPNIARKLKDTFTAHLETTNLNPELIKVLEGALTVVCDQFEQ